MIGAVATLLDMLFKPGVQVRILAGSKEQSGKMYGYLGGVMKKKNARLISAGGMYDHVHLYASLPFTISIADFVNVVKSNSSRWIHESFPKRRAFAWQEGYGAFSVSKSEEKKVICYVQSQRQHHSKRSFKDEFLDFLIRYEIEYDERYLWD